MGLLSFFRGKVLAVRFDSEKKEAFIASCYAADVLSWSEVEDLCDGETIELDRHEFDLDAIQISVGYYMDGVVYLEDELEEAEKASDSYEKRLIFSETEDEVDEETASAYIKCIKYLQAHRPGAGPDSGKDTNDTEDADGPTTSRRGPVHRHGTGAAIDANDTKVSEIARIAGENLTDLEDFSNMSFADKSAAISRFVEFDKLYKEYRADITRVYKEAAEVNAQETADRERQWEAVFSACANNEANHNAAVALKATSVEPSSVVEILRLDPGILEFEPNEPKPSKPAKSEQPEELKLEPAETEPEELVELVESEDEDYILGGDIIEALYGRIALEDMMKLQSSVSSDEEYSRSEVIQYVKDELRSAYEECLEEIQSIPPCN